MAQAAGYGQRAGAPKQVLKRAGSRQGEFHVIKYCWQQGGVALQSNSSTAPQPPSYAAGRQAGRACMLSRRAGATKLQNWQGCLTHLVCKAQ